MTVYANNEINAQEVGWKYVPEFCYGDTKNSPFVIHDHVKGTFTFVQEEFLETA